MRSRQHRPRLLFSAYAEVFLQNCLKPSSDFSFLCLRRGVSRASAAGNRRRAFSLPTQRCFSTIGAPASLSSLFSAYAEVFLALGDHASSRDAFLCLRRGVSTMYRKNDSFGDFSLPTQRCFSSTRSARGAKTLFSAYAEVFPYTDLKAKVKEAFLCLRRGVSPSRPHGCGARRFSLPTQRCFLVHRPSSSLRGTFLCLRRGVSIFNCLISKHRNFSLPTQRCFSGIRSADHPTRLFSAYAEVFLCLKAL